MFIELTLAPSTPILINTEKISAIISMGDQTTLHVMDPLLDHCVVHEDFETVKELLNPTLAPVDQWLPTPLTSAPNKKGN